MTKKEPKKGDSVIFHAGDLHPFNGTTFWAKITQVNVDNTVNLAVFHPIRRKTLYLNNIIHRDNLMIYISLYWDWT